MLQRTITSLFSSHSHPKFSAGTMASGSASPAWEGRTDLCTYRGIQLSVITAEAPHVLPASAYPHGLHAGYVSWNNSGSTMFSRWPSWPTCPGRAEAGAFPACLHLAEKLDSSVKKLLDWLKTVYIPSEMIAPWLSTPYCGPCCPTVHRHQSGTLPHHPPDLYLQEPLHPLPLIQVIFFVFHHLKLV